MPVKRRANGPWVSSVLGKRFEERAEAALAANNINTVAQWNTWIAVDANLIALLRSLVKNEIVQVSDTPPIA